MNEPAPGLCGGRSARGVAACLAPLAVAALCVASPAAAAEPTASIKTFVAQPILDGPATCTGCGAAVQLKLGYELEGAGYGATSGQPSGGIPPLSAIKLFLPEGVQVHPGAFAECTVETLRNFGPSACPSTSSVSHSGSALGEVSFGTERIPEEAELQAFVGEGAGLSFYEAGHSPVSLEVAWKGRFINSGQSGFGEELISELPPIETVPGAPLSSTKALHLRLGSLVEHSGETTPYLTLPKTCPTEGLSFKTELTFGGEPAFHIPAKTIAATTSKVPCPSGGGVKFTTTSLSLSPKMPVTNQTVSLTAAVSVIGGGSPHGSVSFTEFGFPTFGCESRPLAQVGAAWVATCETTFAAAFSPEELGATFESSDAEVEGSTAPLLSLAVARDSTTTALAVSNAAPTVGTKVTYTATVTPAHTGPEVPFGSVEFLERGSPLSGCQHRSLVPVGAVSKATCTLTYTSGGTAIVSVSYPGDPNFTGSLSPIQLVTVHGAVTEPPSAPSPGPPGPSPAGGVLGSTAAVVSAAQIATLLGQQLVPSGKAAKIGALLKSGGFRRVITALEGGTEAISWYQVPPGTKIARKAKPILVAAGRLAFLTAGTATIKLRLTAAGKALLKRVKKVALTARGAFAPTGAPPVVALRKFTLRR